MKALNYETLSQISAAISSSKDLGDVSEHIVNSLQNALGLKGCALMLLDRKTQELKVAASAGLSHRYINKGPLSALKSIAQSISEGPVAITDAQSDPRLQYPEQAKLEGINSILSVPVILREKPLGVLRLYTAEKTEFTDQDLVFFQAIAEIIALVIDNIRLYKGLKSSIEVLKVLRAEDKQHSAA